MPARLRIVRYFVSFILAVFDVFAEIGLPNEWVKFNNKTQKPYKQISTKTKQTHQSTHFVKGNTQCT